MHGLTCTHKLAQAHVMEKAQEDGQMQSPRGWAVNAHYALAVGHGT